MVVQCNTILLKTYKAFCIRGYHPLRPQDSVDMATALIEATSSEATNSQGAVSEWQTESYIDQLTVPRSGRGEGDISWHSMTTAVLLSIRPSALR